MICLKAEVLSPPVRTGNRLPVQFSGWGIERLEHGKSSDVDASHRQSHGVTAEVVSERFDLGKFRHDFQVSDSRVRNQAVRATAAN